MTPVNSSSTIIYENNVTCVVQVKKGYIKWDKIKHILLKFFYTHKIQKSWQVDVKQIHSPDNLVDLFTKSLPISIFEKLVYDIGMRQVNKL